MASAVATHAEIVTHPTFPIIFGPRERPLVGRYHVARGPSTSPLGVVLCNPLGFEAMSVHRTYRHLAERLASRGIATLRFDYEGSGDSWGDSEQPGRVAAWVGNTRAAIDELRARSGVRGVTLFGVRFGATIAVLAAAQEQDVEGVVAWAPVVSGRAHVRELRAFQMVRSTKVPALKRTDGSQEIGGYLFAAESLADMSAVDLLGRKQRIARRALVLPRANALPEEKRLVADLKEAGVDAQLVAEPGYAGMMRDDPYEAVVPAAALDSIADWIGEGRADAKRSPSVAKAPSISASPTSMLTVVGRAALQVRETPLLFGPGGALLGVLTEPQEEVSHERPAVCLLNVGANHQVGPHRMNVDLARELASLGYLAFRFDVAGLGDSPAADGGRENLIYAKDSVADVQEAMTLLGDLRGAKRFVLVGLCSGAYLAFHTAVVDARVAGQVLLSSYAFEWEEGDPVAPTERKTYDSTRSYLRALLSPRELMRALRGDVDLRGIAAVLVQRVQTQLDAELPWLSARLLGHRGPRNEVERAFRELCERGVESLLVSSFDDGGLDMIAGYLGSDARRMRGYERFALEVVDGADHTFTSLASQRTLSAILRKYLRERFEGRR